MDNPLATSVERPLLREAAVRRAYRRSVASAQLSLPAVPGMIDEYMATCAGIFAAVGRPFTPDQLADARAVLVDQLALAYAASPRSNIVITFDAPIGTSLSYFVKPEWSTVESAYEGWVSTREPPPFGTEPDARVLALSMDTANPTTHRVLDVGAGTGRNALALSRRGHPVDVVELNRRFADTIRADAGRELLNLRVIQRDIFATTADLMRDYQLILLSEVVSDFRSTQQLRGVFELATECLAPGGRLVFNAFLARDGYLPDDAARELGQQTSTSIFTRDEVADASAGLPLELTDDDSVYDYEKAHLADGAWPPTSRFAEWVSGLDVFDVDREECPIEMRWLVYRKPTP
jgi:SAM-dependent methyltransferase